MKSGRHKVKVVSNKFEMMTAARGLPNRAPDRRSEVADHGRNHSERTEGIAALGTFTSAGALFTAAACCVLPLVLAGVGISAGGLAAVVPYHWPLTIAAGVAVGIGWFLYLRKRRACVRDASCTVAPSRATVVMLSVATLLVSLSAIWPGYLQQPLVRLLGGA